MMKILNKEQFQTHMKEYYELVDYEQVPSVLVDFFENRSKQCIDKELYVKRAYLNIAKVNVTNFLNQSKMKSSFANTHEGDFEVYIFEYLKPYYNHPISHSADYAHAELIQDLYVHHKPTNQVIAYLEARIGITNFVNYFDDGFIGMIRVEEEYKRQQLGTLMMRISSSYLFYRNRKRLFSGTTLSPEMLLTCQSLSERFSWVEFHPYFNEYRDAEQDRYQIYPIRYKVSVRDSADVLTF